MDFKDYQDLSDLFLKRISFAKLKAFSKSLSESYRAGHSTDVSFKENDFVLAYFFTRFPATYAVAKEVLGRLQSEYDQQIQSVLDLGAGLGSFSLAAHSLFGLDVQSYLVEDNREMLSLSKEIFNQLGIIGFWQKESYLTIQNVKPLDIACLGYTLTELSKKEIDQLLERVSDYFIKFLVIVEPGTPKGYQNLMYVRDKLLKKGLNLLMPCPHHLKCPLSGKDWCHFIKRLPRTSLHKQLKGGCLGYEDEKFSYLVFSKTTQSSEKDRVLTYPQKASGLLRFRVCSAAGVAQEKIITKKDKSMYKAAKKLSWGDVLF